VIEVAAISTKNLSALVSHQPRDRIASHIAAVALGKYFGGAGGAVDTRGSYLRSFHRLGWFLNAPRKASTDVGVRGLPITLLISGYWRPESFFSAPVGALIRKR
jgi:hypothetical protein